VETAIEYLDKAPLIGLVIVLLIIMRVGYKEWRRERDYRDSQELKTLEALVRVAEVVKDNTNQSQKTHEILVRVEQYLNSLSK